MTTFTATAEPDHVPPRVRLDFDTEDLSTVFTTITVLRNGESLRAQPPIGSSVSVAYDYEAPFGIASSYTVMGTTSDLGDVYSTTWANLADWTTEIGNPGVAANRFRTTDSAKASVLRAQALPAAGRLTFSGDFFNDGVTPVPGPNGGIVYVGGSNGWEVGALWVFRDPRDPVWYVVAVTETGPTVMVGVPAGSGGASLTWAADGTVVLDTGAASYTFVNPAGPPTIPRLVVATFPGTQVPGFTIENHEASSPFDAADSTTLDVAEAWLIHPANPSLSCSIGSSQRRRDGLWVKSESGQQVTRAQKATTFNLVGRTRPVVVTNGARGEPTWSLVLHAPRLDDWGLINAITNDQTPLILRVPFALQWDLIDDYYSVGDITEERTMDLPGWTPRNITLPLTPVDPPILSQLAEWTYADDLAYYATCADSLAAEPTYFDRLIGRTGSGGGSGYGTYGYGEGGYGE